MAHTTHTLAGDVPATLIPAGDVTTHTRGTEVFIVQTLGGNVTVRTDRGLYRIAREHVAAIAGYIPTAEDAKVEGEFSEQGVCAALKTCFDPEFPVIIVDLGLFFDLAVESTPAGGRAIDVKMTLTAPGCGMGPVIAEDARQKIAALPTVERAKVHIVWDPQWTPQMISETGRKALGLE